MTLSSPPFEKQEWWGGVVCTEGSLVSSVDVFDARHKVQFLLQLSFPCCLIQVRQCKLTSQACELKMSSWCWVTDTAPQWCFGCQHHWIQTHHESQDKLQHQRAYTRSLETHPHIALLLLNKGTLQEMSWQAAWKGRQDCSWCAWMAWAGKDGERQGGGRKGWRRQMLAWPTCTDPTQPPALCSGRVCWAVWAGLTTPENSLQDKGLALRQDLHFFP